MGKLQILIVNDRAAAARELETRLTTLGYDVAAIVSSGADAVAAAASATPELVVMDAGLHGDLDAVDAADAITGQRPIPVVFIGTEVDEARLQRLGTPEPYGYLVPPFSDRELHANIELALYRHRAARTAHELEAFFALSLDMFCFLDANGYFIRLNAAWERTLGFTRAELMSRPSIDFVHPDDRERTLRQNRGVRAGGQAWEFENRYRCKDGSYRWLLWNAATQSADGLIYSAARDVTARKQVEAERTQLVRELEASLAEVRTLQAILPICMYCKKIRDDEDYWGSVEGYISRHTETRFSHGICPSCMETEVEPQLKKLKRD